MVSWKWLTTLTSPEETSTQVEVAFTAALTAEDLLHLADQRDRRLACGDRQRRPGPDRVHALAGDGQLPLLLARSPATGRGCARVTTREFMAGVAIAQQFGRSRTPQDQAWIETLFGHVEGEWPHLEKIVGPGELDRP